MGQHRRRRKAGKGRTARGAPRAGAARASLYDEVTAKIVGQLEAGIVPWVQPWSSAAACTGLPRNAVTGRPYSGINVLLLWGAVIEGGYPSQNWLTFRQALAAGGCVRNAKESGKTIKGVIADCLTGGNGRPKREAWVPRWMAFPPTAYTERGGVPTVSAANRARWIAEQERPREPDSETGETETASETEDGRLAA